MADPRPALLIVGDSHSVALKEGCDALGLRAEVLSFSGNFWHQGHIFLHRSRGLWAKGRALQERITQLCEKIGVTDLVQPDLPILASFGFHLGRMVPPFGFHQHTVSAATFAENPAGHFASRGLVEAYCDQYRHQHLQMLQRLSRLVPTVAVAPPNFFWDDNYQMFFDLLKSKIRASGVTLFDPCETLFAPTGTLPEAYTAADRVHGNARYGEAVMRHILQNDMF